MFRKHRNQDMYTYSYSFSTLVRYDVVVAFSCIIITTNIVIDYLT